MTKEPLKQSSTAELLKTLFWAILLAVILRTFAFESFRIPSGSMYPTNYVGDFLFVNKFAYGYSHYSLPFSPPIFKGRVLERAPERGDVVVFRPPHDTKTDFIKRLVGMPGDRVQLKEGVVFINDVPVQLERIEDYQGTDGRGTERAIPQYRETLPNGVSHLILKELPFGKASHDNTMEYVVPEGHYFFMGDNRDNSRDSRYITEIGFVPAENLVGRAEVTYFSVDTDQAWWKWPISIRLWRMFRLIR